MATKKSKDITRALHLVESIRDIHNISDATNSLDAQFAELKQILTDIDARRTRRDPSKGGKPATKKRVVKASK